METIPENNTVHSPVNGTDDREARSFHWYAARTQMNCERKVEKRFQQFASETYLPTQEEIHQWSDRKKKVQRMVIPMILFVKINKEEAQKVHARKDNQFYGFVSTDRSGRIPAEISNNDIQTLKYMLGASDKPIIFEQNQIDVGDEVEIVRGALKGVRGMLKCAHDGTAYLIVDMGLLGYIKTEIGINDCMKIVSHCNSDYKIASSI
jgi:transcription antitermination factor NusG